MNTTSEAVYLFCSRDTDQSVETTPGAIFGDDPQLGMYRKCVYDQIDVLRIAISQLGQDLDFMQYSLDALIFLKKMHLEVMWIYVNDLESDNLVASQVISSVVSTKGYSAFEESSLRFENPSECSFADQFQEFEWWHLKVVLLQTCCQGLLLFMSNPHRPLFCLRN